MSRYTVAWREDAVDELTEIWLAAADRIAVTAAADSIDNHLANNPSDGGQLLAEDLWAMQIPPLRVYYHFSDQDRMVWVDKVALRW